MKQNQISKRGGIEDFLCPFSDMFITQGAGGSLSHSGTMANDVNHFNGNTTRVAYYAPCKVKCIITYPTSGQVMWQSVNKVRCANGYVGIVTFMTAHDDSMDSYSGQIVEQGKQLGNMGTKGFTTGVHCHIEISQSADISWIKNQYGVYCFKTEKDPSDCYFVDGTNILNMQKAGWKYLKDVFVQEGSQGTAVLNSIPNDFKYETATFTVTTNSPIKIRRAPSLQGTDTGLNYVKGNSIKYDGYVNREGYTWISWISLTDKTRRWMACGKTNTQGVNVEPWGTFK